MTHGSFLKGHIMEEQNIENSTSAEKKNDSKTANWKKRIIFGASGLVAAIIILWIIIHFLIPKSSEVQWLSNKMIAIYIAIGFLACSVAAWFILRKTLRTRLKMQMVMKQDPDVNDWLIIFNWTPKILYTPTIVASLVASVLMFLNEADFLFFGSIPGVVIGSIWLAIFS